MNEKQDMLPLPASMFDAWFLPFAFWSEWWNFYAETLNVAHACPVHEGPTPNDAKVHVEDEEGLVA
ncbi:hypothetical protein ACFOKF_18790 [Sphingobium rhizovicinum]|uniref:Uncharacterized protein n=1 Tax=Sphingobium rhizovicinum TaxID=432308 RepID=A0ABV7NCM6_9SPHN